MDEDRDTMFYFLQQKLDEDRDLIIPPLPRMESFWPIRNAPGYKSKMGEIKRITPFRDDRCSFNGHATGTDQWESPPKIWPTIWYYITYLHLLDPGDLPLNLCQLPSGK